MAYCEVIIASILSILAEVWAKWKARGKGLESSITIEFRILIHTFPASAVFMIKFWVESSCLQPQL